MATPPPALALAALVGPTTRITRRVDIYEEDAVTPFLLNAPFEDGSISVDGGRDERRTLDMSFENVDGDLDNYPGGFWYDKVIKPYRGITWEGRTPSWVQFDNTNYLTTPDSPGHNITSAQFSIRAGLSMVDWTPGAFRIIMAKWVDPSTKSYEFFIDGSNRLTFEYSTTGAAGVLMPAPTPPPFADGSFQHIGVDFYVNNGAGGKTAVYLTSVDGITWIEYATVTESSTGTTALFDSSAPLTIGGRPAQIGMTGRMDYMQVFDGARTIIDADFTNLENGQTGMEDAQGTALSFSNGISKVQGGTVEEQSWETQLGEFLIDRIDSDNFPNTVKVTGRDRTKALMEVEFTEATAFQPTDKVEDVIRAIATAGNVTRMILPFTGNTLGRVYTFESGTKRWDAIKQICTAFGYEVFIDNAGYLVMQMFQDPVTSAVVHTFESGEYGNLVKWAKSSSDTLIKNQVVVRGEATDVLPVSAIAENHEPSSPTSIENLNRIKTMNITSPFITTEEQAMHLADHLLQVQALEAFDVNITSLVFPWLEAHQIVEFLDPNPNPGDPTRFLLSSFTIPMSLAAMTAVARRVTLVG